MGDSRELGSGVHDEAVLRPPDGALGRIFQSGDEPLVRGRGQRDHVLEHSVDPVPYPPLLAPGFDVDLRGPVAHGLLEDHVREAHHRGIFELEGREGPVAFRGDHLEVAACHLGDQLFERVAGRLPR